MTRVLLTLSIVLLCVLPVFAQSGYNADGSHIRKSANAKPVWACSDCDSIATAEAAATTTVVSDDKGRYDIAALYAYTRVLEEGIAPSSIGAPKFATVTLDGANLNGFVFSGAYRPLQVLGGRVGAYAELGGSFGRNRITATFPKVPFALSTTASARLLDFLAGPEYKRGAFFGHGLIGAHRVTLDGKDWTKFAGGIGAGADVPFGEYWAFRIQGDAVFNTFDRPSTFFGDKTLRLSAGVRWGK